MTAMLSMALAVLVTAGLALAAADHLAERVEQASSRPEIAASGLGLESVGAGHSVLHGMVANPGTVAVRVSSVSIAGPVGATCAPGACALELAVARAGGAACSVGGEGSPCTLLPGESMAIGPSVHAIPVTPRERYVVMVSAEPVSGGSVSLARGVMAR
ncbi:MAG: hypothetical protein EB832_03815 [Thaumarchaeota archaeon S14]|nr:MAG: hypothetical protein EB832_03815 [Thaumarchaeota archaeon S14]